MKHCFSTMAVCLLIASSATAQVNSVSFYNKKTASIFVSEFESYNAASSSNSITVEDRVSKNFAKDFSGITDAVWTKTNSGFHVNFMSNGIQTWAALSKKGICLKSVRYYSEKNLPVAIRTQVKNVYSQFNITSVQEVYSDHTTAYLVTIADAATWKVIRVVNGEMDIWKEYVKG